ncbi:MAG: hypothetical protein ACJAYR_001438 [Sneathiella sp.]|jgi:hypothetical protein
MNAIFSRSGITPPISLSVGYRLTDDRVLKIQSGLEPEPSTLSAIPRMHSLNSLWTFFPYPASTKIYPSGQPQTTFRAPTSKATELYAPAAGNPTFGANE